MKKIILLAVTLFTAMLLPAQGVYQLWGMTATGGSENSGVIFSTDAAGNNYLLRHDFIGTENGNSPYGGLTQFGGKLYGMTGGAGQNGVGVIFEWDPSINGYIKKYDFNGENGSTPFGSLSFSENKFYGITFSGGSNNNNSGVIFEWDPVMNIYTKKIDLTEANGSNPFGSLTLKEGKFYGMTYYGGINNEGVIFEWDPTTNIYTKKIDFNGSNGKFPSGNLTLLDDKFYGMTRYGGNNDAGVIFEWDPSTNLYTKKVDLNITIGSTPSGSLTLAGGKLYGMTNIGGTNSSGVIFEWDPSTNLYQKKYDFENTQGDNGSYPVGSLTISGRKFYGLATTSQSFGKGVIFEWDPVKNIYTKKKDFKGNDGANPDYGNSITLVPAPIAKGLPGSCINYPVVTIDNSNNNQWVSIIDEQGNAVAEIKANGNNLGLVTTSMFINNAKIREDRAKRLYLDRNITITPQVQPTSPVDIRLYIKSAEYAALKNAVNSNGQLSGISSINDVGIYRIDNGCLPAVSLLTNPVATSSATWQGDYVFSSTIFSFSSFYFAAKCIAQPPHITEIYANPDKLWPPNHQMKNVTINYTAWSNCGAVTSSLSVTSNEPIDGTGHGDKSPDWIVLDDHHVQLRAERNGHDGGRLYTITITSTDVSGNTSTEKTKVMVPRQKQGSHGNDWGDDNDGYVDGDGDYHEHKFDCKVIPNPSKNYFIIQVVSATNEKIEARLLDLNGKLISKLYIVKNQIVRFGDDLRPGVYMVEITQGEQRKTIKVIKQ